MGKLLLSVLLSAVFVATGCGQQTQISALNLPNNSNGSFSGGGSAPFNDGLVTVSGSTMTCGSKTLTGVDFATFSALGDGQSQSYYYDKNAIYSSRCEAVLQSQEFSILATGPVAVGQQPLWTYFANGGHVYFISRSTVDLIDSLLTPVGFHVLTSDVPYSFAADNKNVGAVGLFTPEVQSDQAFLIPGADASSFQTLVRAVGTIPLVTKDASRVYLFSAVDMAYTVVTNVDVSTFAWSGAYQIFYDKNVMYAEDATVRGAPQSPRILTGVNPGPVKALGVESIFSNGTQAFTPYGLLSGLDGPTLTGLVDNIMHPVVKDKNHVYFFSNLTQSAAYTVLNLNASKAHQVLTMFTSDYVTDDVNVYFQGTQLVGADGATFQSTTAITGQDKNFSYTQATKN